MHACLPSPSVTFLTLSGTSWPPGRLGPADPSRSTFWSNWSTWPHIRRWRKWWREPGQGHAPWGPFWTWTRSSPTATLTAVDRNAPSGRRRQLRAGGPGGRRRRPFGLGHRPGGWSAVDGAPSGAVRGRQRAATACPEWSAATDGGHVGARRPVGPALTAMAVRAAGRPG